LLQGYFVTSRYGSFVWICSSKRDVWEKSPSPLVPHYTPGPASFMKSTPYRLHNSSIFDRSLFGTTYTPCPSLVGNTNYDFSVRATNATGDGLPTTTTLLTVPDIPTSVLFPSESITQTTLTVNWTAPTGGAVTYKVARCTGAGCTNFSNVYTGVSGTTQDDSGLTANTTYRYEVLGTNATGDGCSTSSAG
jgi:hypothetical protein